ncbi:MAG TPA: hypothetical protein VFR47_31860 [Anaerolineales bacterium]|nr:hypothetical protein [Anaerolineales bacterium]
MPRRPSQMIQTSHGLMEYALHGAERGAAVILCHGTGGGYDQGLMLARLLDGFQGIAVSRAGYLRTPVGTGCSPGASPALPGTAHQGRCAPGASVGARRSLYPKEHWSQGGAVKNSHWHFHPR